MKAKTLDHKSKRSEDNPVPSLDDKKTENNILFNDLEKIFGSEFLTSGMFDAAACKRIVIPTKKGNLIIQMGDLIDHYWVELIKVPEKLQNGVETDKQQPKCISCNHILKDENSFCDECGYDQGV